jgi:hypothetical protein
MMAVIGMGIMPMVLVVMVMLFMMSMAVPVIVPVQIRHIMVVVVALQPHSKIAGIQAGFFCPGNNDLIPLQRKGVQRLPKLLLIRPQIQQCPDSHITTDTGETFQI